MRLLYIYFLGISLVLVNRNLQGQQAGFHYAYGTPQSETSEHIRITRDGGCITAGQIMQPPAMNTFYGYAQKTAADGNLTWAKKYQLASSGYYSDAIETDDGGYVFAGTIFDSLFNAVDIVLVKTDSSGNVLWSKQYDGGGNETVFSILQTSDSGLVVLGETMSLTQGYPVKSYVFKTDRAGTLLWTRIIGGSRWNQCRKLLLANGGVFIVGTTNSFGDSLYDVWVTKLDDSGYLVWSKTYGGASYDNGYSGINTNDGGLLITGISMSYDSTTWVICLIKTDGNGDTLWTRLVKKPGTLGFWVWGAEQTNKNNYVISAHLQMSPGFYDGYLLGVDSLGNFSWAYRFSDTQYIYDVKQASDDGLMLLGNEWGLGYNDILLIKTDENGQSGCFQFADIPVMTNMNPVVNNVTPLIDSGGVETGLIAPQQNDTVVRTVECYYNPLGVNGIEEQPEINIFPSPSSGEFKLIGSPGMKTITIINILGEVLSEETTDETIVYMKIKNPGLYYITILTSSGIKTGSILIMNSN